MDQRNNAPPLALARQRRRAGALLLAAAATPDQCRVQAQGGMLYVRSGTVTCLLGTTISNATAVSVAWSCGPQWVGAVRRNRTQYAFKTLALAALLHHLPEGPLLRLPVSL
jgi:hypothetical protein